MSLSSDLNLLASNNIIGYDTCAQTLNGMGVRRSGYNPYGVGKLNTGVTQDTFSSTSSQKAVKNGILGGLAFAVTSKLIEAVGKEMPKGKKYSLKNANILNNVLGIKHAKRTATKACKTAPKGLKGILSKAGKIGKGALIVTGIGTIAAGALKFYNASQRPLSDNGQPQQ